MRQLEKTENLTYTIPMQHSSPGKGEKSESEENMKDSAMDRKENQPETEVILHDPVFAPRRESCRKVTIPSSLRRCRETGRIDAFRLQWKPGDPNPPHIFWDSDVAKVLEGMAEMLMLHPDPAMEKELNDLVDLVVSAQQKDGYLNVYFTALEPEKRWSNLSDHHELYCAGHLMEAAVAHFRATGSRKFLDAVCRYADLIASVFGPEPGQKRGYPGHEEIELALVKLYRTTGEKRYLELAKFFIDERGKSPNYFSETERQLSPEQLPNRQAHQPVREQEKAVGHAVRAVYLYCGMTDVAVETGDPGLLNAAIRLFDNLTERRMYITGGIGSTSIGEAFTEDFDLPNATAYAESCAAIGLALLSKRLLDATGGPKYADVLERVLYNNGLSGISLSGDEFFYANLLEVNASTPEHGVTCRRRRKWFGCSCCPTNYCRFLPQLGRFCYAASADLLRVDIPAAATVSAGTYKVRIDGNYPYDGAVSLTILRGGRFTLSLRIPGWCEHFSVEVNGSAAESSSATPSRWTMTREWKSGDRIELNLELKPVLIYPHPSVAADAGRAAIQRGPVVYCMESVDNPGIPPQSVILPADPDFRLCRAEGLPEGTVAIRCGAKAEFSPDSALYRKTPPRFRDVDVCAIPYALWQNRGESSMQVFLRVAPPEP